MRLVGLGVAVAALIAPAEAWAAPCFNVARDEPHSLTGVLDYVMFPGPPNYSDVRRGDTPEPSYVLRLSAPICLMGDETTDPSVRIRAVQVVSSDATRQALKANLHKTVTIGLKDAMGATTGHHHEPLVAWATYVRPLQARPMEFIDEYGTAATVIRAFYAALHSGQGAVASSFIIPEKRGTQAFSPSALSSFYGSLATPIEVVSMAQRDASNYVVQYRYQTRSRTCNGRANVATEVRGGRNYIQAIRALDGC